MNDGFQGKGDLNCKFGFYDPEKANPCAELHLLTYSVSTSVQTSWLWVIGRTPTSVQSNLAKGNVITSCHPSWQRMQWSTMGAGQANNAQHTHSVLTHPVHVFVKTAHCHGGSWAPPKIRFHLPTRICASDGLTNRFSRFLYSMPVYPQTNYTKCEMCNKDPLLLTACAATQRVTKIMHKVMHTWNWIPLFDLDIYCRVVVVHDLITCANFGDHRLRLCDGGGVAIPHSFSSSSLEYRHSHTKTLHTYVMFYWFFGAICEEITGIHCCF